MVRGSPLRQQILITGRATSHEEVRQLPFKPFTILAVRACIISLDRDRGGQADWLVVRPTPHIDIVWIDVFDIPEHCAGNIHHSKIRTIEISESKIGETGIAIDYISVIKFCCEKRAFRNVRIMDCCFVEVTSDKFHSRQISPKKTNSREVCVVELNGNGPRNFFQMLGSFDERECVKGFLSILRKCAGEGWGRERSGVQYTGNEVTKQCCHQGICVFWIRYRKFAKRKDARYANSRMLAFEHQRTFLVPLNLLSPNCDPTLLDSVVDLLGRIACLTERRLCLQLGGPRAPGAKAEGKQAEDGQAKISEDGRTVKDAVARPPILPCPFNIGQQQSDDSEGGSRQKAAEDHSGAGVKLIFLRRWRRFFRLAHVPTIRRCGKNAKRAEAARLCQWPSRELTRAAA